jgi:hypothetical protein
MLPVIPGEIATASLELICCVLTWLAAVVTYIFMPR